MSEYFTLHRLAAADLDNIVDYSRRRWGDVQARRYIAQLKICLKSVSLGEGQFKVMTELVQPLRVCRCQHHYVYCLPREDGPAIIIAILHERMDLMARIADRLT